MPEKARRGVRGWTSSVAKSAEPRDGSDRTARKKLGSFSSRRAIARRATDRDTRGSREDSSAVNARTQVVCCSWTRVEARLLDAREPSCGVSRRGSVRFCLSFPPSARAARGPVVATAREARGRVARLGEARGDGWPRGKASRRRHGRGVRHAERGVRGCGGERGGRRATRAETHPSQQDRRQDRRGAGEVRRHAPRPPRARARGGEDGRAAPRVLRGHGGGAGLGSETRRRRGVGSRARAGDVGGGVRRRDPRGGGRAVRGRAPHAPRGVRGRS
jgi:hypothetical protein